MGSHIAPLLPNDSLQDMLVGAVSEQVTVQAEAELIQTRTAAAGQLVDEKRIIELPLNGRRPERLVYLAAGTVDLGRNACRICGHGGVYPGEETAGVNGAGLYQVNFQLDGTSHDDTYIFPVGREGRHEGFGNPGRQK